MELELLNEQGQAASKFDAPETVFGREYNEALVHQIVVAFQANARQGTRAQKDREMVKHSTKKPFKQKGTGRARAGMTSSPLWRGGGRIFPNSPEENFTQKINKKMYRAGMASIFSQLAREGRLAVVDSINLVSVESRLSIGLYDLVNVEGDIIFRAGRSGETYKGIGKYDLNLEGLPVFADTRGPHGSPTSDSERTMVTSYTRRVIAIIISFSGDEIVDRWTERLVNIFQQYASGTYCQQSVVR